MVVDECCDHDSQVEELVAIEQVVKVARLEALRNAQRIYRRSTLQLAVEGFSLACELHRLATRDGSGSADHARCQDGKRRRRPCRAARDAWRGPLRPRQ